MLDALYGSTCADHVPIKTKGVDLNASSNKLQINKLPYCQMVKIIKMN